MGIKYGKYCGVGYSGCPGEKPCDDIDACCMAHDDCVGKFGTFFNLNFINLFVFYRQMLVISGYECVRVLFLLNQVNSIL